MYQILDLPFGHDLWASYVHVPFSSESPVQFHVIYFDVVNKVDSLLKKNKKNLFHKHLLHCNEQNVKIESQYLLIFG